MAELQRLHNESWLKLRDAIANEKGTIERKDVPEDGPIRDMIDRAIEKGLIEIKEEDNVKE